MRPTREAKVNTAHLIESVAAGLAFGSLLWWISVCLIGAFRPQGLAAPYWSSIPGLRTDTSGFFAFLVAAVCLTTSEYLRLCRRQENAFEPPDHQQPPDKVINIGRARILTQAVCKSGAILSTGLVCYLSVVAVTQPTTLGLPTTHMLTWPTEDSLRVMALAGCAVAVSVLRFLRVAKADYGREAYKGRSAAPSSYQC